MNATANMNAAASMNAAAPATSANASRPTASRASRAIVRRAGSNATLAPLDCRIKNARMGVPTGLDAIFTIMFEVAEAPLSKIYGGRAACASRALAAIRVPFDEGMRMSYGEFCQRAFELHDKEPERYRTVAREISKRFRRELERRDAKKRLREGYDIKLPQTNRLIFMWGSIPSSDYLEAACLAVDGSPVDEVLRAIERSEAGCPKDIATLCAEPRKEFTMDEFSHMTVEVEDDASEDDVLQEVGRVLWEHSSEEQSAGSGASRPTDEACRSSREEVDRDEDILAQALLIEPFAAIYRADQIAADQNPFIDWDEEIL